MFESLAHFRLLGPPLLGISRPLRRYLALLLPKGHPPPPTFDREPCGLHKSFSLGHAASSPRGGGVLYSSPGFRRLSLPEFRPCGHPPFFTVMCREACADAADPCFAHFVTLRSAAVFESRNVLLDAQPTLEPAAPRWRPVSGSLCSISRSGTKTNNLRFRIGDHPFQCRVAWVQITLSSAIAEIPLPREGRFGQAASQMSSF